MKQEAKLAKETEKEWIEGSEENQETAYFENQDKRGFQSKSSVVGDAAGGGSKMKDM